MKSVLAASGLGLALFLAACAPSRDVPPEPAPATVAPELPPEVRVGLLLPLSGPAEALGQDMLEAAQMALFDVGANDLVLLPRDTGGTPDGARRAAEAVLAEGAEVILGPLFSQAVGAVGPVATAADVRVLAFSNVATVAAPGTFVLGFRPEEQVVRVTEYAAQQVERQSEETFPLAGTGTALPTVPAPSIEPEPPRLAGLAPDDPYGATTMAALSQAVTTSGAQPALVRFYPPAEADPSAVVREVADYDRRSATLAREVARVEALDQSDPNVAATLARLETLDTLGGPPFDAIMLADGGARLRSVASLLNFFDVEPDRIRYLGTMRWQDDPAVLEEAALQGGWFAAPAPANIGGFEARFETTFGRRPQLLAALAYDATALAVIVARNLGDRAFTTTTLTNPEGFAGATGLFRLRPDGLAEHGLAILEVSAGTARVIETPPASFVDQTLGF